MPSLDVVVACPVYDSFRVQQVAGMFDVPIAEKSTERFQVAVPDASEDWQIGLVVGPSGSGKSTIARHAYAANLNFRSEWASDRAVIDGFGDLSVRDIVSLFTAVGFGSPPSWVKPYQALSNGEQFRCDLAQALARCQVSGDRCQKETSDTRHPIPNAFTPPLVAFDEFTSVVDRNVAKVCSAAIAKQVRNGNLPCRFVAITCHYDVAEWLEPDWILDMGTGQLLRRCLWRGEWPWQRPRIDLEIHRCRLAAWSLFKRHHYLSGSLAPQARCYLATWRGVPVHFCATLPVVGKRGHRRFSRIVTLPDYQGLGIGMKAIAAVAALHRAEGLRINVTSSHPALVRHCRGSPLWKTIGVRRTGSRPQAQASFPKYRDAAGRAVVSFEYIGTQLNIAPKGESDNTA